MSRVPRFLVISLGNQHPYFNTRHSAGHHALIAAQKLLTQDGQGPWHTDRYGGKSCKASIGPNFTMIQSPTAMNVSGLWVKRTYRGLMDDIQSVSSPLDLGLIVVHDELESEFGVVKPKKWTSSHKGHNGVKSILGSLKMPEPKRPDQVTEMLPSLKWSRITVGIGRPVSRDHDSVASYVLTQMTRRQVENIDSEVGPQVVSIMNKLKEDWEREQLAEIDFKEAIDSANPRK